MRSSKSYMDVWVKKLIGPKPNKRNVDSQITQISRSAQQNGEDEYERLVQKLPSVGPLDIEDLESLLKQLKIDFEHGYNDRRIANLDITDFNLIRTLGAGSFGKVILAKRKLDDTPYAIKLVEKKRVMETHQFTYVFNEKRILQGMNFPFVVYLKYFFVDYLYLYYAMPYVPGGDFYYYLKKVKSINNKEAKFYAGQLVLALEYLHYLGLIHRDIKPENIMIDAFGYIKLADFGQCLKYMTKAWTFTGTPEYMAPEVILGKGYDVAADWWSIGVTLFEICAGNRPFKNENRKRLYEMILKAKYEMPSHFHTALQNLVKKLLDPIPHKRIGNERRGAIDVKNHLWFRGTDWLALLNRTLKAPYIPEVQEEP